MCLAIPARVEKLKGRDALVDFRGVKKTVSVAMLPCKVGDYVIVHAGYAISKMDKKDALEDLELWREVMDLS
jgi:hydrogenase expression/formation protein HypC